MSLPREGSREIDEGIIVSEAMDWCNSPTEPVPYRIWAKQVQATALANSVRQTDDRSHVKGSLVLASYGDEPGVGGGVVSGTRGAECTPKTWSDTVFAEGRNMVRHDDEWWMNHKNTYGRLTYVEDTSGYPTPDPQLVKAKMQVAQAATGTMNDAAPTGVDAPSISSPGTAARTVGGALATPEAAGAAGGLALGGVAAGVGLIGISRGNAIVEDAGRAQVGLPPQTRTPIMGLPLNLDLSATGAQAPVLPRTDSMVRTSENNKSKRILCHYTNPNGQEKILSSQTLLPSLKANNPNDAYYGDGQYLSDIQPGTMTNAQLSRFLSIIHFKVSVFRIMFASM